MNAESKYCVEKSVQRMAPGSPEKRLTRSRSGSEDVAQQGTEERGNTRDETRDSRGEHMVVITKKDGDNNDADDVMRPDPKFVISMIPLEEKNPCHGSIVMKTPLYMQRVHKRQAEEDLHPV